MKDESFGIIPVLRQGDRNLFLVIQHHKGHWGFPKGHAEVGESPIESARRELEEETGLQDYQLLEDISLSEHYSFVRDGQHCHKTVQYFLAFAYSDHVTIQAEEIQSYQWATYEEAIALITFQGTKQVLIQAKKHLESVT